MILNDEDFEQLKQSLSEGIPTASLARTYKMSEIELLAALRQNRIVDEVRPIELQYIKEKIKATPAETIRRELNLTKTQFAQICERLKIRRVKPQSDLTLDEVLKKTKWLIEERLHLTVDDSLPRELNNDHFLKNDLYHCIKFAEVQKKNDVNFKHFPAVAFLVCQSYPRTYQPFQFRHAKTNQYFRGSSGKKNFLNAVEWVVEKKLGLRLGSIDDFVHNKYFLKNNDLQFYGIGPHWYREHFGSKQELINELKRIHAQSEDPRRGGTQNLKKQLMEAGVAVDRCYVESCLYDNQYGIEIHHIVPRKNEHETKLDIHSAPNLVPLCPNHHAKANTFNWKQLLSEAPEKWRPKIVSYLLGEE